MLSSFSDQEITVSFEKNNVEYKTIFTNELKNRNVIKKLQDFIYFVKLNEDVEQDFYGDFFDKLKFVKRTEWTSGHILFTINKNNTTEIVVKLVNHDKLVQDLEELLDCYGNALREL